jgi:hypothetical protein
MGKEKHDKYASYIKRQVALAVEKKQLWATVMLGRQLYKNEDADIDPFLYNDNDR